MTRILHKDSPSLDYELWNNIRAMRSNVNKKMGIQLASKDRGGSRASELWKGSGRFQIDINGAEEKSLPMVVDFLSLHSVFEDINERIQIDSDTLYAEIQALVSKDPKWAIFFEGATKRDWLTINWPAFGRVIGAAVSNQAKSTVKHWTFKGTDALDSLRFWNEFCKSDDSVAKGDGLSLSGWNNIVEFYTDRNYDPETEVARSLDHLPSAPFRRCVNTKNVDVVMPNPLALNFRKQLHATFGLVDGDENPEEIQKSHGKVVMEKLLKQQIVRGKSNHAGFLLFIHSLCAHHMMRGNVAQQKIGLHLVSMLGIRLDQRGVGGLNVPDLAHALNSGFQLGAVLRILRDSKLVEWSFVDHASVISEAKLLKSKL